MYLRTGRLDLPPKGQIVFLSDLHIDSDTFDREAWESDKDLILRMENPHVLINGDMGTLIMFNDKRFAGRNGAAFYQGALDVFKAQLMEELGDIAPLIKGIGRGNHETTILRKHGHDVVRDVIRMFNVDGRQIEDLGYTGYIELRFAHPDQEDKSVKRSMYYHHGAGGNAPVTGGAIDLFRMSQAHRADIYWIGHKHVEMVRGFGTTEYDYGRKRPIQKKIIGLITPGYDGGLEVDDMDPNQYYQSDWATERFYAKQPQGFAWADFEVMRKRTGKRGSHSKYFLRFDVTTPNISEG